MALGTHYLAEYYDCDRSKINDISLLERIMIEATELSGARIIRHFFHQFSPQGLSGIIVIAESHFAVHTWPEHGFAAVDLFSCGDFDFRAALNHIRLSIGAERHFVTLVRRGTIAAAGGPCRSAWEEIDII
jgi:S-adenosylmethionine decarboxylase